MKKEIKFVCEHCNKTHQTYGTEGQCYQQVYRLGWQVDYSKDIIRCNKCVDTIREKLLDIIGRKTWFGKQSNFK